MSNGRAWPTLALPRRRVWCVDSSCLLIKDAVCKVRQVSSTSRPHTHKPRSLDSEERQTAEPRHPDAAPRQIWSDTSLVLIGRRAWKRSSISCWHMAHVRNSPEEFKHRLPTDRSKKCVFSSSPRCISSVKSCYFPGLHLSVLFNLHL